jgi:hypothetical protein
MLMLIVMTYSVELIGSLLVGLGLGFLFFVDIQADDTVVADGTTCHCCAS